MYERYPDGSAYDYQIFLNDPNIWDKCSFDRKNRLESLSMDGPMEKTCHG